MSAINLNPEIERIIEELKHAIAVQIEQEVTVRSMDNANQVMDESKNEVLMAEPVMDLSNTQSELDDNQVIPEGEMNQTNAQENQFQSPTMEENNQVDNQTEMTNNYEDKMVMPTFDQGGMSTGSDEVLKQNDEQNPSTVDLMSNQESVAPIATNEQSFEQTEMTDADIKPVSEFKEEPFSLPEMPLPSGFDSQPSPFVESSSQMGEFNQLGNTTQMGESLLEENNQAEAPVLNNEANKALDDAQALNQFGLDDKKEVASIPVVEENNEATEMMQPTMNENSVVEVNPEAVTENKIDDLSDKQQNLINDQTISEPMETEMNTTGQGFNKARGILDKVLKKNWSANK